MRKNTREIEKDQAILNMSLEDIARVGAEQMLKVALGCEIQNFLRERAGYSTQEGLPAFVRNGFHKERPITIGSGTIAIRVPRSRNRLDDGENFVSRIIPPYMRRSLKIDEAIPLLYLRGLSNGDFIPCLEKLFDNQISGISPASITRMKKQWFQEHAQWCKKDLTDKQYCYVWVDGVHFNVRWGNDRLCVLVAIGALEDGTKELIAVEDGYRESTESWAVFLRNLKDRGMPEPMLFIGDGALGFWKAVRGVYPGSKHQRCWVHKTANVLDALPKSIQPQAKSMLQEIYTSPTCEDAEKAYRQFVRMFEAKYPKATEKLSKDIDKLLTFYSFPAQHWVHIRSTNPIESTFSTVRLRSKKTRGHGTRETTFVMVFKLIEQASLRWRKLKGHELIKKVIEKIEFTNGEMLRKAA